MRSTNEVTGRGAGRGSLKAGLAMISTNEVRRGPLKGGLGRSDSMKAQNPKETPLSLKTVFAGLQSLCKILIIAGRWKQHQQPKPLFAPTIITRRTTNSEIRSREVT